MPAAAPVVTGAKLTVRETLPPGETDTGAAKAGEREAGARYGSPRNRKSASTAVRECYGLRGGSSDQSAGKGQATGAARGK